MVRDRDQLLIGAMKRLVKRDNLCFHRFGPLVAGVERIKCFIYPLRGLVSSIIRYNILISFNSVSLRKSHTPRMMCARPRPVCRARRAHISCMAAMRGKVTSALNSCAYPTCAPVCAYVPMPEGSSSDAPVISPGPSAFRYAVILPSQPRRRRACANVVAFDGGMCTPHEGIGNSYQ